MYKSTTSLIVTVLLLGSGPGSAADLQPGAPLPSVASFPVWQGFYVGGALGVAEAVTPIRLVPGGRWLEDTEAPFLAAQGSPKLGSTGFIGGAQIGYNLRVDRVVVGTEGDFNWTDLSSRRSVGPFPPFEITGDVYSFGSATRAEWLSTLRGRLGYLVDERTLVYATGGAAFAGLKTINGYGNDLGPGLVSVYTPLRSVGVARGVNVGWTVGGGLEYALTSEIKIKAEYIHAELGHGNTFTRGETLFGVPVVNGFFVSNRGSLTENIGRVGINFALR